jgi:hypothetical protein
MKNHWHHEEFNQSYIGTNTRVQCTKADDKQTLDTQTDLVAHYLSFSVSLYMPTCAHSKSLSFSFCLSLSFSSIFDIAG